jgi:ATP-dependent RNA helicase DeaD
MTNFSELSLNDSLRDALKELNFHTPTPIQSESLPLSLVGKDIIGCAQTGTGKTLAYSLPILEKLINEPEAKALILVPTRELALQVQQTIEALTKNIPNCTSAVLIGGISIKGQIRIINSNPRIFIATPGRLNDLIDQKKIKVHAVKILVLDEADRMMDMGFLPQIHRVLKHIPHQRQNMFFTATMSKEMRELSTKFMKDPQHITVGPVSQPVATITQEVLEVLEVDRHNALVDELNAREGSILIFTRTKHRTEKLFKFLREYGFRVAQIHGDRSQAQRTKALDGFRNNEIKILIATDIAARGIDISHIAHVINFDLPQNPDDYVHRVGRTARAGATGQSLSFVTEHSKTQWQSISRTLPKNTNTIIKRIGSVNFNSEFTKMHASKGRSGFQSPHKHTRNKQRSESFKKPHFANFRNDESESEGSRKFSQEGSREFSQDRSRPTSRNNFSSERPQFANRARPERRHEEQGAKSLEETRPRRGEFRSFNPDASKPARSEERRFEPQARSESQSANFKRAKPKRFVNKKKAAFVHRTSAKNRQID